MKKKLNQSVYIGEKVHINSGPYEGEWGIIEDYDGDNYYVALWGDTSSMLVFDTDEILLY